MVPGIGLVHRQGRDADPAMIGQVVRVVALGRSGDDAERAVHVERQREAAPDDRALRVDHRRPERRQRHPVALGEEARGRVDLVAVGRQHLLHRRGVVAADGLEDQAPVASGLDPSRHLVHPRLDPRLGVGRQLGES